MNILLPLSSLLVLISPIIYTISILKGESKPHRTTRFVLMFISILATTSLFAKGDQGAIWLSAATTIQSILVFLMSLKFGMGGRSKLDVICLVIAIVGIILWQTSGEPLVGLFASMVADFVGIIPALIKTYHLPHTETWLFYGLDMIASIINFVAIPNKFGLDGIYPFYLICANLIFVLLILSPRKHFDSNPNEQKFIP